MTYNDIKLISLDGFKDGFEAAVNLFTANMDEKTKKLFLEEMKKVQKEELKQAEKIWYITFYELINY